MGLTAWSPIPGLDSLIAELPCITVNLVLIYPLHLINYLVAAATLLKSSRPEFTHSLLACLQLRHGRVESHFTRVNRHQSHARET